LVQFDGSIHRQGRQKALPTEIKKAPAIAAVEIGNHRKIADTLDQLTRQLTRTSGAILLLAVKL